MTLIYRVDLDDVPVYQTEISKSRLSKVGAQIGQMHATKHITCLICGFMGGRNLERNIV